MISASTNEAKAVPTKTIAVMIDPPINFKLPGAIPPTFSIAVLIGAISAAASPFAVEYAIKKITSNTTKPMIPIIEPFRSESTCINPNAIKATAAITIKMIAPEIPALKIDGVA